MINASETFDGTWPFNPNFFDGNGLLFPAIALQPKAAFIATIYSGIPAIIVSYSYFFIFEFY